MSIVEEVSDLDDLERIGLRWLIPSMYRAVRAAHLDAQRQGRHGDGLDAQPPVELRLHLRRFYKRFFGVDSNGNENNTGKNQTHSRDGRK